MSKLIPQSFIDDLLAKVDITEIVGARIKLRKSGSNYTGLCPFHSEKTPSFTVSQTKQFFHCFGCGAHGSAIGFIMDFDSLTFVEAVETLAAQLGLTVPKTGSSEEQNRFSDLYKLNEEVSKLYRIQLKNSPNAINYLKSRGFTGNICKTFGIGYAANNWDNLLSIYRNSASKQSQLSILGLLIIKDKKCYSRFRDRIMFPIRDRKGNIIGFGGRVLKKNDAAKYLNSPETPLFHKGSELYGLYEAKKSNKNLLKIIVVEGYIDVVTLVQFGISNAVATLGTAITTKQAQELLRQSQEIIFCFDGDAAGRTAAWRALENTLPLVHDGIQIKFLFLPETEDPDSFVRKYGTQAFLQYVEKATPLSDFFFARLLSQVNPNTLDGKAKLAKTAKTFLDKIPHGVFQELMFKKLGSIINIDIKDLNNFEGKPNPPPKKPAENIEIPQILQSAINLLMHNPGFSEFITNLAEFSPLNFPGIDLFCHLTNLLKNKPNLAIGAILENYREHPDIDVLVEASSKEPIIPKSGLKSEFLGILQMLKNYSRDQSIKEAINKAAKGELGFEEKLALQKLIQTAKLTEVQK